MWLVVVCYMSIQANGECNFNEKPQLFVDMLFVQCIGLLWILLIRFRPNKIIWLIQTILCVE